MSLRLSLVSAELDAADLQALTRDFCNTANQEDGLSVELAHEAAPPGTRSPALIRIGSLALTFLSSSAAAALINVCKSYFERNSSLELSFEREDGKKLSIKAQNVRSDQIARTLETVREFSGTT
jgi:hypothetical protein